jgi:hypothetical protein
LYATLVDNGKRYTVHKRYCVNCMMEVFKDHHSDWLPGLAAFSVQNIEACTSCGTVVDNEARLKPLYVTAYSQKNMRVDYYAYYCEDCSVLVRGSFDLKESVNGKS